MTKFSKEEAFQLLLEGIRSGSINFPFLQKFNEEEVEKIIKAVYARNKMSIAEGSLSQKIPEAMSFYGRADAIYIRSLIDALTMDLGN